jgi:hypothetical protein
VAPVVQMRGAVLEIAQPETRARTRSHPRRFTWGIVDAILALVLLPFGVWVLAIDRLVAGVAWLFNRD